MIESENSFYISEIIKNITQIAKECINTKCEIITDLNQNNSGQLNKGVISCLSNDMSQIAGTIDSLRDKQIPFEMHMVLLCRIHYAA